jgi:cytoskeletal protein RodZ
MSTQEPSDEWIRQQVASLDDEPVAGFEQDAVWHKLYPELQPPRRRTAAWWRWGAAAAVLLVLGVAWWGRWAAPTPRQVAISQSSDGQQSGTAQPKEYTIAPSAQTQYLSKPVRAANKKQAPVPNEAVSSPSLPEHETPALPTIPSETATPLATVIESKAEVLPQNVVSEPAVPVAKAAVANAKPRFRVVHTNELMADNTLRSVASKKTEDKDGGFIVLPKGTSDPSANTSFVSYFKSKTQTQ